MSVHTSLWMYACDGMSHREKTNVWLPPSTNSDVSLSEVEVATAPKWEHTQSSEQRDNMSFVMMWVSGSSLRHQPSYYQNMNLLKATAVFLCFSFICTPKQLQRSNMNDSPWKQGWFNHYMCWHDKGEAASALLSLKKQAKQAGLGEIRHPPPPRCGFLPGGGVQV